MTPPGQKIYKTISLENYDPAYAGQAVTVWVNYPRSLSDEYLIEHQKTSDDVSQNNHYFFRFLSTLWPDWSEEDVKKFFDECIERDPKLVDFLLEQTTAIVNEYRNRFARVLGSLDAAGLAELAVDPKCLKDWNRNN